MNEITLNGRVTATPDFRFSPSGVAVINFSIAINRSRPNGRGGWTELPTVFQRVVAFRRLAENANDSIDKGVMVTVTGQLSDNSFTPEGEDRKVRQTQLEAADIAVSLRFATATVARNPRDGDQITVEPSEPAADEPAPATEGNEEPRRRPGRRRTAAEVA